MSWQSGFINVFFAVVLWGLGILVGYVRGYDKGYNAAREIWDDSYEPITLKRKDHEAFEQWQKDERRNDYDHV